MTDADIAIVGSGFGGSLLSMIARRLGKSVILLERHSHPRMVIGESSTPLANLMLEELAVRYELPSIRPFAKWGSWKRHHPDVACGLKRGFSFFAHNLDRRPSTSHLLVAASPHDEIADTHWYRPDFDAFLVQEAQRMGVEYLDHALLDRFELGAEGARLLGTRSDAPLSISAKFVVDATGPRGFLHHVLGLRESVLPRMPPTQAIYNHFTGVGRLDEPSISSCPFPVDDAAVHHVFDGGWIWVLRFNNGVTSAGVAATANIARSAAAWPKLLEKIPELGAQFSNARPMYDFKHIPRLSFRSGEICGDRWALLPSAAGFVDPLLSTGFPLTLLGIGRLARTLENGCTHTTSLRQYARNTDEDLRAAASLIAALYANMARFPLFSRLSLLYFAAVSYAESAHRLGKPCLASSYLLREHPTFGPKASDLLKRATLIANSRDANALSAEILEAIEPIDVAGLQRNAGKDCFPVDAGDLLNSAAKLHSSHEEISAMLERSGFYALSPE